MTQSLPSGQRSCASPSPLLRALREPGSVVELPPQGWNTLLKQARAYGVLARLAVELEALGCVSEIPEKAKDQLLGARQVSAVCHTGLRFEIGQVRRALADLRVPVILLKGAAYLMAGLPPARGRVSADLDILVPRATIDAVETALLAAGWEGGELSAYDEHYYRAWAHEIPPLRHRERGGELDVHHTILPLTHRARPDAAALIAASEPLPVPGLAVLGPADMVLHGIAHLFADQSLRPLRDLVDLHDLLEQFGNGACFWDELLARARLHNLQRALYYALRYTERILGTRIPSEVKSAAAAHAPVTPVRALMDEAVDSVMRPTVPGAKGRRSSMGEFALYVRSLWIRMPPLLLSRHLARQALRRGTSRLRDAVARE